MRTIVTLVFITLIAPASSPCAQSAADSSAIRATALDYIEGWYTGDAGRMQRAVHPELVKRIVVRNDGSGEVWLDDMGATKLVSGTRAGFGTRIEEDRRRNEVTILDIFANAASVRVDAADWIDYMHMVKWDGRWVIVNVLWEMRS